LGGSKMEQPQPFSAVLSNALGKEVEAQLALRLI
jgi:hypothetical protein